MKFKHSYWRVSEDAGALGTGSEASASVQRGGEAVLVVGGGTGVHAVPVGGLQLAPGAMALSLPREGRPPSEEDQRVTREHLGKGPGGRKDVHPQELPLRGRRSQTEYSVCKHSSPRRGPGSSRPSALQVEATLACYLVQVTWHHAAAPQMCTQMSVYHI